MMRFVLVFVLCMVTNDAMAQCPGVADRLIDYGHDGTLGFFIPQPDLACLLQQLELVPLLQERIDLLTQRAEAADRRYAAMLSSSSNASSIIADQQNALQLAMDSVAQVEAEAESWFRRPVVWFMAGILTASALGVGAALAFGG